MSLRSAPLRWASHRRAGCLQAPVAVVGGFVSFFSLYALTLVHGYLPHLTGLAELAEARSGRTAARAGFEAVFVQKRQVWFNGFTVRI
jgi:hypothetical protein